MVRWASRERVGDEKSWGSCCSGVVNNSCSRQNPWHWSDDNWPSLLEEMEPLEPATGEDEMGAEGWRMLVVEPVKSNTLSCGNLLGLIGVETLTLEFRDRLRVWRLGKGGRSE